MTSHYNWLSREVTIECHEVTPDSVLRALDLARAITDRHLAGGHTEISGSAQKVSIAFPMLPIHGPKAEEIMDSIDDLAVATRFTDA